MLSIFVFVYAECDVLFVFKNGKLKHVYIYLRDPSNVALVY